MTQIHTTPTNHAPVEQPTEQVMYHASGILRAVRADSTMPEDVLGELQALHDQLAGSLITGSDAAAITLLKQAADHDTYAGCYAAQILGLLEDRAACATCGSVAHIHGDVVICPACASKCTSCAPGKWEILWDAFITQAEHARTLPVKFLQFEAGTDRDTVISWFTMNAPQGLPGLIRRN